jgi:hypothetical protein
MRGIGRMGKIRRKEMRMMIDERERERESGA